MHFAHTIEKTQTIYVRNIKTATSVQHLVAKLFFIFDCLLDGKKFKSVIKRPPLFYPTLNLNF